MARFSLGVESQAMADPPRPEASAEQPGTVPPDLPRRRATDSDAFAQRVVHLVAKKAWRPRLRAASIHLAMSLLVVVTVVGWVLGMWYPQALAQLSGVHTMLAVLVAVDVVIGPVCTFLIFDRRKRGLSVDLAIIGALQLAALAYGVHVIEQGRPQFVVLVKDRFEVVAPSELTPDARLQMRNNVTVRSRSMSPQWVAAKGPGPVTPASVLESMSGGRGWQHRPDLYEPLGLHLPAAAARGIPLAQIRHLNPGSSKLLDQAVRASGEAEENLRVLPLRGLTRDASVLVSVQSGRVNEILLLHPW